MLDFIINHSIHLAGLLALTVMLVSEYQKNLRETNRTQLQFWKDARTNLNDMGGQLMAKFLSSVLITIVISMVSFKELWMNDCFHIVFITNLLMPSFTKFMKELFFPSK